MNPFTLLWIPIIGCMTAAYPSWKRAHDNLVDNSQYLKVRYVDGAFASRK